MTERPTPLARRRLALSCAIAAVAILVACETRRPAPVAPVTSYTVEDGQAKAAASVNGPRADSTRVALQSEMRMKVADTVLAGDPNAPVLVVYSSSGALLYSARMPNDGQNGMADVIPLNPEAIATMAVEKRKDLLPEKAKGGLIRIVLKPGAEDAPGTWKGSVAMRRSEAEPRGASAAGPSKARIPIDSILVVVLDANGTQLLRARGDVAMPRVDQAQVATVDVYKNDATLPDDAKHGMIKIVLKPGGALKP